MSILFDITALSSCSLQLNWKRTKDKIRVEKFKEAIFANVHPGDVVIDLGTGTGILAIWAAQAGAKKVYAIEETDVAEIAEAVVQRNGFDGVIEIIKSDSKKIEIKEKGDVLIAELVGHFVFEEGIVEYISDARNRFLKERHRIIPEKADVFVSLADTSSFFDEVSYWDSWNNPILSPVKDWAQNSAYVCWVDQKFLVTEPKQIFHVDFKSCQPDTLKSEFSFSLKKNDKFDGIVGWFDLHLGKDIVIHTGPNKPKTHWHQTVFPSMQTRKIEEETVLKGYFKIEENCERPVWKWGLRGHNFSEDHSFFLKISNSFRLLSERF